MRLFLAVVDNGSLTLAAQPLPLSSALQPVYVRRNVAAGVSRVQVSAAGGQNFWLTYELSNGMVERCFVNDTGTRLCVVPVSGLVSWFRSFSAS